MQNLVSIVACLSPAGAIGVSAESHLGHELPKGYLLLRCPHKGIWQKVAKSVAVGGCPMCNQSINLAG